MINLHLMQEVLIPIKKDYFLDLHNQFIARSEEDEFLYLLRISGEDVGRNICPLLYVINFLV